MEPDVIAAAEPHSLGIGPFGSNLKVSDYSDTGVPLVFVRNIRAEAFVELDDKFISKQKAVELEPHRVTGNDVLITKMGEPPGDSAIYPPRRPDGVVTADCIRWRISQEAGEPRFFAYATRSPFVRVQILEKTRGVAQRKVSLGRFKQVRYPLAPIAEQQRIVAELDKQLTRLDAAVRTLEGVRTKLKRARASVLKAAVEGRLVPTEAELARAEGRSYEHASELLERILAERKRQHEAAQAGAKRRKRYAPPARADFADLPTLPNGWVWSTVDAFLANIQAGKSFKCDPSTPRPEQVGIVKVSAVTWGKFDELESKTVDDPGKINPAFFIRPGDLLFSRANTIELVGACVLVGQIGRRLMLSDKILRLETVDPSWNRWLLWVLRSGIGRVQIEALATGNQHSMRNIGQARIRRIAVPLPPQGECERILDNLERRLSVFDALDATVEQNLQRCTALRQSLLKRAFEGKLVPQDPNDEPASELLARIKAGTKDEKKKGRSA